MIRIAGIIIPDNKHVVIALRTIYGIGKKTSLFICKKLKLQHHLKFYQLSEIEINLLRKELEKFILEGDLRRQIGLNIKRLIDIKCYRGIRHKKSLPVRGQRTRTNAKTVKNIKKVPKNSTNIKTKQKKIK